VGIEKQAWRQCVARVAHKHDIAHHIRTSMAWKKEEKRRRKTTEKTWQRRAAWQHHARSELLTLWHIFLSSHYGARRSAWRRLYASDMRKASASGAIAALGG